MNIKVCGLTCSIDLRMRNMQSLWSTGCSHEERDKPHATSFWPCSKTSIVNLLNIYQVRWDYQMYSNSDTTFLKQLLGSSSSSSCIMGARLKYFKIDIGIFPCQSFPPYGSCHRHSIVLLILFTGFFQRIYDV